MPEYTALTQSDQGPRSTSSTTIAIDDSATKICFNLSNYCFEAPAIDAIEYLTGNLYDTYSNGDKYIGPPTAEREQSWRDLWQHEATMVENWAMPILNRTDPEPYESVKSDGKEGFTAISKVYHQLGCLDLIRQYTWLQAGKYPQHLISLEMQKPADEMRGYINRCIEDLRISLLCYSDMTPLLVTKERDLASGFKVELNSHYKCRNFQKLQEWTNSHGVEHWEKHDEFHQHDRL
ncbi:uncharacterized protein TRUGW13939_09872 [Talaromyces rugulosus]|uniref:Uncharacterized protein n=1 Tax=Talaromyces rugulosus TaxID=121627 RepID=A0A7H8RAD6_TALRU|nr:uncharacterized protein TRUGW13939_09872 [Talaromyces rugulosus]QKX62711.1 hypothetical protein TRUGW13939_09872 [Talaromyces rugulosus]